VTTSPDGQSVPKRVRILLVDDAALIRHVVQDFLSREPNLEVVGTAENGRIALTKIHLLEPDAVVLDIEMPVMDGWETLKAIRLSHPHLPVFVFSSLAPEAATVRQAESLGERPASPSPPEWTIGKPQGNTCASTCWRSSRS